LPEFLKAKSTSYGHWLLLVQAVAFAVVLAAASPVAARTIRLVVLGDSLTAGLGLPPGKAFPDRLQAALRARGLDVDVLNAGVSGDTAADGLARYDWAVPANADALIVELGANDMLRGLEPEATKKALSAILDKAHAARLPTLIAGMRGAPNLGAEYDRAVRPRLQHSRRPAVRRHGDRQLLHAGGVQPRRAARGH
jgi:acyl-CoA thioesterase-1